MRALDGHHATVLAQVQFGETPEQWAQWTKYESAVNHALGHLPLRVACTYDERKLPAAVMSDAVRTHPMLFGRAPNDSYLAPEDFAAEAPPLLRAPDKTPQLDLTVAASLGVARREFSAAALAAGLGAARVEQLTVGVSEVLSNGLLHGHGEVRLRCWSDHGRGLLCSVDDEGPGPDALTGFKVPEVVTAGGRGLWLARQFFDTVEIVRTAEGSRALLYAALTGSAA